MKRMAWQSLARNTRGATTLEFALVAVILVTLLLGGMELGLIMWTRGTLQSVAAQTARCAAIGSPLCANPKSYAVNQATALLAGQGLVTAANVTATTATSCLNEPAGTITFEVVTITASPWFAFDFSLFSPATQTVTACYPI
jgi:Flp pilus assembly protein TadG